MPQGVPTLSAVVSRVGRVTFSVHRATASDHLADGLAALLAEPVPDPFAQEVVAVPARGVERWLAQRLSHRLGARPGRSDGVTAGIRFLSPHSLVALVLGVDRDDPWHPAQLMWPVLEAVDACLTQPWARVLAAHLGEDRALAESERDLRRGRRLAVARRLATLFTSYAQQRPAMLTDWRLGGEGDGLGGVLDADLAWQPRLWREVLGRVAAPAPDERLADVLARLGSGAEPEGLDLPGRLSLFGHTRIARSELQVLAALGRHRDVHLWLPQASPAAWERLAAESAAGPVPRDEDRTALLVRHPLLASLGRDARELQRTLALAGGDERPAATETEPAPTTLLGWLQHDIRTDHEPDHADVAARHLDPLDRSLQVHACHGRGRQVDVVRDVLADLLQRDPRLEPRDVLVMCPDIDAYAPLVHAGFGLGEVVRDHLDTAHPAHGLRVSLADRAPQETNPLLALAARLVEFAGARLTAGEVLDLSREPAVRARFGFDEDDLERVAAWVEAAQVRWGLDAAAREVFGLHNIAQNTWRSGIDRVVVGAALDGQEVTHLGSVLALDDLDSGDIDLAGRLAELVERLGATLRRLGECRTPGEWMSALRRGVLDLTDTPRRDAWQVAAMNRELARVEAAARGTATPTLRLADVAALLEEHREGRPTRSNFRTGTLTVCTMVPMRSVPHRVICLVGLDDGVFPRTSTPAGDDALARRPVTGERDPRSEDRQLLLDAVMAARQTLVVTYTGADEHTGAPRPPAVPLGELIDQARVTASGKPVQRLVTHHPLQPYDPRNLGGADPQEAAALETAAFEAAELDAGTTGALAGHDSAAVGLRFDGEPFSYDPVALLGGRALVAERTEPAALLTDVLPEEPGDDVDLLDLQRFFANPVGAFLRGRLGIVLPDEPEERVEGIPLDPDGLARWGIGSRLLDGLLAGRTADDLGREEIWRGELPPHTLGERVLAEESAKAQALAAGVRTQLRVTDPGEPVRFESRDVDLALPSGRRLVGTVGGIVPYFPSLSALTVTYSTIAAKHRLASWLTALVLAATGDPFASSHVIGHKGRRSRGRWVKSPVRVYHGQLDAEAALAWLDQLVDVRARGMREPIPLSPKTSAAWAQGFGDGDVRTADDKARYAWETDEFKGIPGEQDTPAHVVAYGERAPLSDVLGTPRPDELWFRGATSRLGQYALRVFGPITGNEREVWL